MVLSVVLSFLGLGPPPPSRFFFFLFRGFVHFTSTEKVNQWDGCYSGGLGAREACGWIAGWLACGCSSALGCDCGCSPPAHGHPTNAGVKVVFLKGYNILRIALSIVKNNEDGRVFCVINHWLIQNLRTGGFLWRRRPHTRIACTILPNQNQGKVHKPIPTSDPCVWNWVGCISGKVHTVPIFSSWKKKTTWFR